MEYKSLKDYVLVKKDDIMEESEVNYFTFLLGYDLLTDRVKKYSEECDCAFEYCEKLARKFMNSELYLEDELTSEDALAWWIEDNKLNLRRWFIEIKEKRKSYGS